MNERQQNIIDKYRGYCSSNEPEIEIEEKRREQLIVTLDKKFEIGAAKLPLKYEQIEPEILLWLSQAPTSSVVARRVYISMRVTGKQDKNMNDDRAYIFAELSKPVSLDIKNSISLNLQEGINCSNILTFFIRITPLFERVNITVDNYTYIFDKRNQKAGIIVNFAGSLAGIISRSMAALLVTDAYYNCDIFLHAIRSFNRNPLKYIATSASVTNRCVFCDAPLGEIGQSFGYGPVCAKKYNLFWSTVVKNIAQLIDLLA